MLPHPIAGRTCRSASGNAQVIFTHGLDGTSISPTFTRPRRVYETFILRGWPKAMGIHSREAEGGVWGARRSAPQNKLS